MRNFFPPTLRWPALTLRRELVWAVILKLLVLLAIKLAFFPERPRPDDIAQGMAARLGSAPVANAEPRPSTPRQRPDPATASTPNRENP